MSDAISTLGFGTPWLFDAVILLILFFFFAVAVGSIWWWCW